MAKVEEESGDALFQTFWQAYMADITGAQSFCPIKQEAHALPRKAELKDAKEEKGKSKPQQMKSEKGIKPVIERRVFKKSCKFVLAGKPCPFRHKCPYEHGVL